MAIAALAPGGLAMTIALGSLLYAALGGALNEVELCIWGLLVAVAATGPSLLLIVLKRSRNKLVWCLVLVCVTATASILGFAIWVQAAKVACHGATDCPFG